MVHFQLPKIVGDLARLVEIQNVWHHLMRFKATIRGILFSDKAKSRAPSESDQAAVGRGTEHSVSQGSSMK